MNEINETEHIKEVYARFGLAVYNAQVLEHGLVNALVILDLIPSRRRTARSQKEWESIIEAFLSHQFESTMGQLMRSLRDMASVPSDLEYIFQEALKRRNWLVHDFFRERSGEFMNSTGRNQMLREIEECRACFEAADNRLNELIVPIRIKAGISDELLEHEYQRFLTQHQNDG